MTDLKNELTIADEEQKQQLEAFRKQFNITDIDRFNKAVVFCEQILDGGVKSKVYAEVFGVTIEKARTLSSQFHRAKWVQELLLFLRPDEQSLYFGERKRIIQAGMNIIDDPTASHRDKTEAMKALQPYIKQEKIEQEMTMKVESLGESISDSITSKLEDLAERGKMIDDKGNIIDVMVIE